MCQRLRGLHHRPEIDRILAAPVPPRRGKVTTQPRSSRPRRCGVVIEENRAFVHRVAPAGPVGSQAECLRYRRFSWLIAEVRRVQVAATTVRVETALSGKQVDYTPAEKPAFEEQMKKRGVPEIMVQRLTGFLTDFENGQEDEVTPDLENLLGRRPTSLKEGLKVHFKS